MSIEAPDEARESLLFQFCTADSFLHSSWRKNDDVAKAFVAFVALVVKAGGLEAPATFL